MKRTSSVRIGTAGWTIPRQGAATFPQAGTQLERYAGVFDAVEINSSFHRSHLLSTYQKWAAAVPETFRFAVKIPKAITHERKLKDVEPLLDAFLTGVAGLGSKLGPLLVQMPPSLAFAELTAESFLSDLRDRFAGPIACEPRHASWFTPEVEELFVAFRIGRVAADPAPLRQARQPGGWRDLIYTRLHGSPRIYYSAYSDPLIQEAMVPLILAAAEGTECWCIFDNTASGAATLNALIAKTTFAGEGAAS